MSNKPKVSGGESTAMVSVPLAALAPLDAYNAVVDAAELVGIALTRASFESQPEYFIDREKHELSFGCKISAHKYDSKIGMVATLFEWNISARKGSDENLRIVCVYEITYEGLTDKVDEAVGAFVARVGRIATYPYFRAMVSHIAWESGAELPMLPVIRSPASQRNVSTEPAVGRQAPVAQELPNADSGKRQPPSTRKRDRKRRGV